MGLLSPNKQRGTEAPGDIVRSLLAVLVVVLVVGVYFLFARPHPDPVHVVAVGPELRAARADAPYRVLAPVGLGDRWRPTSAREDTSRDGSTVAFHVGYVTPKGHYAAVEESNGPAGRVVRDALGSAPIRLSSLPIRGVTWQQVRGSGDDLGLVRVTPEVTVVVHGDAGMDELSTLAAALR